MDSFSRCTHLPERTRRPATHLRSAVGGVGPSLLRGCGLSGSGCALSDCLGDRTQGHGILVELRAVFSHAGVSPRTQIHRLRASADWRAVVRIGICRGEHSSAGNEEFGGLHPGHCESHYGGVAGFGRPVDRTGSADARVSSFDRLCSVGTTAGRLSESSAASTQTSRATLAGWSPSQIKSKYRLALTSPSRARPHVYTLFRTCSCVDL